MQLLDFTNVTNKTIGIENYDIIQLSGIPAVDSLMIRWESKARMSRWNH